LANRGSTCSPPTRSPVRRQKRSPSGCVRSISLRARVRRQLVKRVEHLGDQTRLHLVFKKNDIVTVTDAHTRLKSGDIVKIQPDKPLYFDADGMRLG
jgi:ABC-type sugar transport system ATPase subunit